MLQTGAQTLLHDNFAKHPSYGYILDAFGQARTSSSSGRGMTLNVDSLPTQAAKMRQLTVTAYKKIIELNLTFPRYVLPVRLALHLAGLNSSKVHVQAHKVLDDIGFLTQMTGDFADCYYDDESGSDIQVLLHSGKKLC